MAITISCKDYDELWSVRNPISDTACDERIEIMPEQIGVGYTQSIQLRGFTLQLFNYQLHDDLHLLDTSAGSPTNWEFGFNLSGERAGKQSGDSFVEWRNYEEEELGECITYANTPVLKVDIHLTSTDMLYQLVSGSVEELPNQSLQWIENRDRYWFDEINTITPAMRSALEKIWNCSFQGQTRQIYLESQCLELIALKLEQLKQASLDRRPSYYQLSLDDVDRIRLAKTIITEQASHPPSLMALARQVGLNDFKLKAGFRQVFGTTVFGYLHQYRMEQARQLLTQRQMNVKEVARAVGYASPSSFAEAFRKQFGVAPKSYLLSKRSV